MLILARNSKPGEASRDLMGLYCDKMSWTPRVLKSNAALLLSSGVLIWRAPEKFFFKNRLTTLYTRKGYGEERFISLSGI